MIVHTIRADAHWRRFPLRAIWARDDKSLGATRVGYPVTYVFYKEGGVVLQVLAKSGERLFCAVT